MAGSLNPVAEFRGFRMELPVPGHDEGPIQSIVEFFGRDPDAVHLADHSAIASELASGVQRAGFAVRPEIGYPIHV